MKVLIAGAGAIGGWLGARLAAHDVTLLGRPALAEAVADGFHVTGHTTYDGPMKVITEPAGSYDAVFLTCKAHQTSALGAAVAPLVALDGVLATLQNGLGNGEKLARFLPADRIAICLTSHGITAEAPGRLRHAGLGTTKVGPVHGTAWGPAAERAQALLTDAGLDPVACTDIRGHVWQKAIVNAGINPVAALHGVPNGRLLEDPDLAALSTALVRESVALAERARVDLPPGDLVDLTQQVCRATADNKCSMLQDVEAHRVTEIEQITGRMARLGEMLLVPMQRSDFVYGRIKDLERSYLPEGESEWTAWEELEYARFPV